MTTQSFYDQTGGHYTMTYTTTDSTGNAIDIKIDNLSVKGTVLTTDINGNIYSSIYFGGNVQQEFGWAKEPEPKFRPRITFHDED